MKKSSSINKVLAESLAHFMAKKGWTQVDLAGASSVSQRSISNYLNPDQRDPTASGKEASAKLAEVSLLAKALGVEAWELIRPMTPSEREFYKKIERAYRDLMAESPSEEPGDEDGSE
jgi:transcriptional regulator with XRE-family HTH domain